MTEVQTNGDGLSVLAARVEGLVADITGTAQTPSEGDRTELVRQLLGEDRLQAVLADGLRALNADPELLNQFLHRPALIVGLRELAFAYGGPYWDRVGTSKGEPDSDVVQGIVDRCRKRLDEPRTPWKALEIAWERISDLMRAMTTAQSKLRDAMARNRKLRRRLLVLAGAVPIVAFLCAIGTYQTFKVWNLVTQSKLFSRAVRPLSVEGFYPPEVGKVMESTQNTALLRLAYSWDADFMSAKAAYRRCVQENFADERFVRDFWRRIALLEKRYPPDRAAHEQARRASLVQCLKGQFFMTRGLKQLPPDLFGLERTAETQETTYPVDRATRDRIVQDLWEAEKLYRRAHELDQDYPVPVNNLAMINFRVAKSTSEDDPEKFELAGKAMELAGQTLELASSNNFEDTSQHAVLPEYYDTLITTVEYYLILHQNGHGPWEVHRQRAMKALSEGRRIADSFIEAAEVLPAYYDPQVVNAVVTLRIRADMIMNKWEDARRGDDARP